MVKNLPTNAGDLKDVGSIPGRGHGKPSQYSCLENPHGQREDLGGLQSIGSKESDMTEVTQLQQQHIII